MRGKIKKIIIRVVFFALCAAIIITAPVLMSVNGRKASGAAEKMNVLTIWQIDSFEGGKGSRANYLETVGKGFADDGGGYVHVVSLTAFAARENILRGSIPDVISYGAGCYGIENIITGEIPYYTWTHGGYCFITIDESADFSDISVENTVINGGIDNLSGAAALLCGLENAEYDKPTSAYVSLLSGKYKYLLGTQRDIFRLKTREVEFKIKPITEFNDLYQNISIITTDFTKARLAKKYIEHLLNRGEEITKLGLMGNGKYYSDQMGEMEQLNYKYKLTGPVSENTHGEILSAIANNDINLLKKLLK